MQWLLTHSRAAKLLAVRRVTTNQGAKTPGVDNVTWRTDRQKLQATDNLKRHGYKPQPLRRIYIPKKNGKLRPLSIPTLHDRAMQSLHALALAPVAETLGDPNSYGFREGRSCADALRHVHNVLSRQVSPQWVLEGDIKACFDEIGHAWLLQHVLMDRQILRQWLQAGYWEKGHLFPTRKGTPQGGIISPILANIALDGMQKAISQAGSKAGDKVNFVRYADDFIVTGASKELLEQKVRPALTAFLHPRGLELSEQKTVISHISNGFNFLGHTVRKFGDKLLTYPAKSNVKALREKISLCINSALGLSQETLLRQLNPLIRGWANYYRHGASKRTFNRLDNHVFWQLLRWVKRRHPKKDRCLEATQVLLGGDSQKDLQRPACQGEGVRPNTGPLSSYQHRNPSPCQNHWGRKPLRSKLLATLSAQRRRKSWTAPGPGGGERFDAPSPAARSHRIALVAVCRRVPASRCTGWRGLSRMKGNFHVRF